MTLGEIPHRVGSFGQRVRPVDDRPELAGFDQVAERAKVLRLVLAVNPRSR